MSQNTSDPNIDTSCSLIYKAKTECGISSVSYQEYSAGNLAVTVRWIPNMPSKPFLYTGNFPVHMRVIKMYELYTTYLFDE